MGNRDAVGNRDRAGGVPRPMTTRSRASGRRPAGDLVARAGVGRAPAGVGLAPAGVGLALAGAVLLVGCGPIAPTVGTPPVGSPLTAKGPLMAEFDASLATWQSSGITRYAFTYQPQCFCDTTPRLVVSDGDGIRVDGVPPGPQIFAPAGVPGLFEFARRAINGDSATIEYDPVTGVPIHLISDPMREAIDDELTFTVSGWTLDPPDDRLLGEVTRARLRWAALQVLDYSMTVTFGRDVYEVTVRDANPTVRKGGRTIDPQDLLETPTDVWALLQYAADAVRSGRATVALDDEFGYPKRIVVAADPSSVPSGFTVSVTNFRRR